MYIRLVLTALGDATFTALVEMSLAMIAIYAICLAVYRVLWHPFAKYPGPWMAKLTSWWASYHAYLGDLHITMKTCHDQYGSVVRFGPNRITMNTNTSLATIYRSRDVRKSQVYKTWVANNGTWHVINAIDKNIHARKNKHMRQAMHLEKLKHYESAWMPHIDEFIDSLVDETDELAWSKPRNLRVHSDRMMIDIMGKIGFGREMKCQSQKQYDFLPGVIASTGKWNSVNVQSTSLAKVHLGELLYPQQVLLKNQSWKQVKEYVQDRMSASSSGEMSMFADMIDMQSQEHGGRPPINELWVDATVLISGLSDQVATVVSSIIFYLSRNTHTHLRLIEEIRTTFTHRREIRSGPKMDSCTYLNAVFKETLRMSPTTGGAMWREVTSEALKVDDEIIPRGLDVATPIYAIHHNEAYFPDSYAFKPERWLGEDPATDLATAQSAWCPFQVGVRACVAQSLVNMEVKDMIARLIWCLDMRPASERKLANIGGGDPTNKPQDGRHRPGEFQLKDHITGQGDGPYLQFRRRVGIGF